MLRICPRCSRSMAYDSYFGAYICRQCGNEIRIAQPQRETPKTQHGRRITFRTRPNARTSTLS